MKLKVLFQYNIHMKSHYQKFNLQGSYVKISHLSTTDISFCVYNYLSLEIIVGIRLPEGQGYLTNI